MTTAGKGNRIFRAIACGVNIAAATGMLLAAYGGKIDPETTSVPAILAMTFPAWLILTVTLLIIDLFTRSIKRQAWIPALALVAATGPILDYAPLNFRFSSTDNKSADSKEFTLMSYNVFELLDMTLDSAARADRHKSDKPNPTIACILESGADILALQECPKIRANRYLNITEGQADSMNTMYPYRHLFMGENVYSRYPLTPIDIKQPDSPYAWFSAAVADIEGNPTLIISVHLQSIGLNDDDKELFSDLTEGEVEGRRKMSRVKHQLLGKLSHAFKERAKQARLLRSQIDSIGIENVIVAGDFNDIPGCFALRELCRDDFRNAFTDAGCGPTITYHANRFYFHIDHVVYRGNMKATGYRRGNCPNSDHYPVTVTFRWDG